MGTKARRAGHPQSHEQGELLTVDGAGYNDRPRQVVGETNSLRKGLWQKGGEWVPVPLEGEDLLGRVQVSAPLTIFDLDVFCWLCWRWREERPATGALKFTIYRVAQELYGRKAGRAERQKLRASLNRLLSVVVTLEGFNAVTGEREPSVIASKAHLIETLVDRAELERPDARNRGSLRGDTVEVKLASWLSRQLEAGHYTYLDWQILRDLSGLAKRLWVYLEAERFKTSDRARARTWIQLGSRAYTALGVHHARDRDRRSALARAGERVAEADGRYESVVVEKAPIGGWRILATKITDPEHQAAKAEIETSLGNALF
jgi:hypothetical protein